MIELTYECNGRTESIVHSDENVDITASSRDNRTIVRAKALNDLKLIRASIPLDRSFTTEDLIMANGYQSWTETKEFSAEEHLNDLRNIPSPFDSKYTWHKSKRGNADNVSTNCGDVKKKY